LFGWLAASQPALFFSHNKSTLATSQPNKANYYWNTGSHTMNYTQNNDCK
jgi:hypothetical protein